MHLVFTRRNLIKPENVFSYLRHQQGELGDLLFISLEKYKSSTFREAADSHIQQNIISDFRDLTFQTHKVTRTEQHQPLVYNADNLTPLNNTATRKRIKLS